MGSDSTTIFNLAMCCRKSQPLPMSFYNLGASQQLQWTVSSPVAPDIPSPVLQHDGLSCWPTELIWGSAEVQLGKLIWIKDILPFSFLPLLPPPLFFCKFFIELYRFPGAFHGAASQTGVLSYVGGMMLLVREPTRLLKHRLRLCLKPTLMLFIIAMTIII